MSDDISSWTGDVHEGDCMDILGDLPENSVHAVVCDPPYGLNFMPSTTNGWDDFEPKEYQEFCERWARACLRVLRPGGHLLAFSGNRTHHRLFSGVEDAGFEIRDTVTYHYGSGFPKALDVSKAIDDKKAAEREKVKKNPHRRTGRENSNTHNRGGETVASKYITTPATSEAERWGGWKTQLKPATEYVVVARAPLGEGTVAENVMEWGTGALNIDACRIDNDIDEVTTTTRTSERNQNAYGEAKQSDIASASPEGRYPANVAFDEAAARELDRQSGVSESNERKATGKEKMNSGGTNAMREMPTPDTVDRGFEDEGGASRFFYTSKASKAERNLGLPEDVDNEHPTVKPVDLMRWLVQLVTAEGQTVLDPFAGSGTTLLAADYLGRDWIGIERDDEHAELARRRVNNYDPSEVNDWIDDETVTQAEQATLGDMAATDGGDG